MKKRISVLVFFLVLAVSGSVWANSVIKVYGSDMGATVIISGSKEFVNIVEAEIATINKSAAVLNTKLTDRSSNPPKTRQFLIFSQIGNSVLIRTSTGEMAIVPSKNFGSTASAFISMEIQAKYKK